MRKRTHLAVLVTLLVAGLHACSTGDDGTGSRSLHEGDAGTCEPTILTQLRVVSTSLDVGTVRIAMDGSRILVTVTADPSAGYGLGQVFVKIGRDPTRLVTYTGNPEPWRTGYLTEVVVVVPVPESGLVCGEVFKLVIQSNVRAPGQSTSVLASAVSDSPFAWGWHRFLDLCCEAPPPPSCSPACGANASCDGAGRCTCLPGYAGDGYVCTDVDECGDPATCGAGYTCMNTAGSFACQDVDECAAKPSPCSSNATCTNAAGSFACACNVGYEGDGFTCTPRPDGPGPRSPIRFFVTGHSLVDDPYADLLVDIATSRGTFAEYNQQINIGSPIRARTKGNDPRVAGYPGYHTGKNRDGFDMSVLAELAAPATITPGSRYDTLLIIERSDLFSTTQYENTVGYLRHYHDRLIAANPAGRSFFVHSWLSIDRSAPEIWTEYERNALALWECDAAKVNLTLASVGRADRVRVLPAGGAVVELVERALAGEIPGITGSTDARLGAIFYDRIHLNPIGRYFFALVTYATISGGSPVGAMVPPGIEPATANALQALAEQYVREYGAHDFLPTRTMDECRTIAVDLCGPATTMVGRPENAYSCRTFFGDPTAPNNPFKWPDPWFAPLPPP